MLMSMTTITMQWLSLFVGSLFYATLQVQCDARWAVFHHHSSHHSKYCEQRERLTHSFPVSLSHFSLIKNDE